jgi:hypothetical protein
MRWLLKLSRLAFVCNLLFLFAFSLQLSSWVRDPDVTDYIITIGFVMGFVINPVTNLCYFFTALISRKKLTIVPAWLIVANILFLVIDAFYILYINSRP